MLYFNDKRKEIAECSVKWLEVAGCYSVATPPGVCAE